MKQKQSEIRIEEPEVDFLDKFQGTLNFFLFFMTWTVRDIEWKHNLPEEQKNTVKN